MNVFSSEVIDTFVDKNPQLAKYIYKAKMVLNPDMDDPFPSLVESIIYQQLALKAAQSIYGRFLELVDDITPEEILKHSVDQLKLVGLSNQKANYIRNLAEAFKEGGSLYQYRSVDSLKDLTSKEIVDLFTSVKGIGEWTVHMYLIFGLGRLDVLAYTDLGVRKGIQRMFNMEELPTPSQVKEIGKSWAPYETVGTFLAWRAIDDTVDETLD